ncbi:MAG TPA: hypothetical protein VME44_09620 [Streptosporangiaceae bacterium]|nr:hypothetical protein [Streptosporangiaceae bacterium]HUB39193.1 hypothetical protein [Streptosporangiaceae bacterium]
MEVTYPELVHLTFDRIGQSHGAGQGMCRKSGGATEARKVQRDHVIVAAERVLNRTPPDGRLPYTVQQHERFTRPGAMTDKACRADGVQDDFASAMQTPEWPRAKCINSPTERIVPDWPCVPDHDHPVMNDGTPRHQLTCNTVHAAIVEFLDAGSDPISRVSR